MPHKDPEARKAYLKAYNLKNADALKAKAKDRYEQTKDQRAAYGKARYEAKREEIRAQQKAYRATRREEMREYARKRRQVNPDAHREAARESRRRRIAEAPQRELLRAVKARALATGIPFDLSTDDVSWPTVCPVLGIPLTYNGSTASRDTRASIDRIDPKGGYVPGNVCVISQRANRIKSDATVAEIERILAYMRR